MMDPLRPIRLERPSPGRAFEYLKAVGRSRLLHGDFVELPDTAEALQRYIARKSDGPDIGYFIITADNRLAGAINLNELSLGAIQSAQLGYYLFTPFAGHGLMRDALRHVMALAFTRHRLHRLEANIQPDNEASLNLARSAGFRREGFSPNFMQIRGRWRDHERWAITAEDWRAQQGRVDISI